jgi:hypothetical protein
VRTAQSPGGCWTTQNWSPSGSGCGRLAVDVDQAGVIDLAGESIKTVAEYLGHSDPGFTLRTCTHLLPTSEQRTRQAVDRALTRGAGTVDGLTTA